MNKFILKPLPPVADLETREILKKCITAGRYLAELKGVCKTIPNENILINTLALQEAKDSSAVENIITTHDELFKEELFSDYIGNAAAKEVQNYSAALKKGFQLIQKNNLLTNNIILEIQKELERNRAGFRTQAGTELVNPATGKVVYTPPQQPEEIITLMGNLEAFINDQSLSTLEPLVKMALIHYQFESIHPFYDGNGRTGRIINILYLVLQGLLDLPVLYLSQYIIETKSEYYRLLQAVRDENAWSEWVLYVLDGVIVTSRNTIRIIQNITGLMKNYKHRIREGYKFYSQDLLNILFNHPYTKIDFLVQTLGVTRKTAAKYLDELSEGGLLKKETIGVNHYYINEPLFELFTRREGWYG